MLGIMASGATLATAGIAIMGRDMAAVEAVSVDAFVQVRLGTGALLFVVGLLVIGIGVVLAGDRDRPRIW